MAAKTALVIAPHALDEALGCGGATAKLAAAGGLVHVAVMCGGATQRHRDLEAAARRAAAILGTREIQFYDFPENRTDSVALLDLVAEIERSVREIRPAKVFAPHPGNLNIDHRRAYEAAATACRPVPGQVVREVICYEIPSSTDWSAAGGHFAPFVPNYYVDIAATLDRKLAALAEYGPEMRASPHARSPEAVQALAVHRGMGVGLAAAEAFVIARKIA